MEPEARTCDWDANLSGENKKASGSQASEERIWRIGIQHLLLLSAERIGCQEERGMTMTNIRIGKKIVGFMCLSSEEPYPFGEHECVPIFGKMEQIQDIPNVQKKSIEERINEVLQDIIKKQQAVLVELQGQEEWE